MEAAADRENRAVILPLVCQPEIVPAGTYDRILDGFLPGAVIEFPEKSEQLRCERGTGQHLAFGGKQQKKGLAPSFSVGFAVELFLQETGMSGVLHDLGFERFVRQIEPKPAEAAALCAEQGELLFVADVPEGGERRKTVDFSFDDPECRLRHALEGNGSESGVELPAGQVFVGELVEEDRELPVHRFEVAEPPVKVDRRKDDAEGEREEQRIADGDPALHRGEEAGFTPEHIRSPARYGSSCRRMACRFSRGAGICPLRRCWSACRSYIPRHAREWWFWRRPARCCA